MAGKTNEGRIVVTLPVLEGGGDIVEVGLNGVMYLIRRGETVSVPAPVRDILAQAGMLDGEGA